MTDSAEVKALAEEMAGAVWAWTTYTSRLEPYAARLLTAERERDEAKAAQDASTRGLHTALLRIGKLLGAIANFAPPALAVTIINAANEQAATEEAENTRLRAALTQADAALKVGRQQAERVGAWLEFNGPADHYHHDDEPADDCEGCYVEEIEQLTMDAIGLGDAALASVRALNLGGKE